MKKVKFLSQVIMVFFVLSIFSNVTQVTKTAKAEALTGAIFTTNAPVSPEVQDATNANLFNSKEEVYLNGGPRQPGAAGLPNGSYYVRITNPNGSLVLGSSVNAPEGYRTPVHVVNNRFEKILRLWDVLYTDAGVKGFADTDNGGGEYKVWISKTPDFSVSKTDNFKVGRDGGDDSVKGAISGYKFYDKNLNGVWDNGEEGLSDWTINLYNDVELTNPIGMATVTDSNGYYAFTGLPAGTYYVAETMKSGWAQTAHSNLSETPWLISTAGMGSYKVVISSDGDAYGNLNFGNTNKGRLIVKKFYDADTDSEYNPATEGFITGWNIKINGEIKATSYDDCVLSGHYIISECLPVQTNWMAMTPTSAEIDILPGQTYTVKFGNLALGAGGGLTLGFWSNKNGQAKFNLKSDNLALLKALNLRDANGTEFDPASYDVFKKWLLSATATNMAYMLSAQLAAMELNVNNGFVNPESKVWTGSGIEFITIDELMDKANSALTNGFTPSGSDQRSVQERLKNILDRANNNVNFVLPSAPYFSFQ